MKYAEDSVDSYNKQSFSEQRININQNVFKKNQSKLFEKYWLSK